MKSRLIAFYALCVAIGLALGWWFVSDCQRYDERYLGNDDYPTWKLADWNRWKELHWDNPEDDDSPDL
jgi:hypothetical protein